MAEIDDFLTYAHQKNYAQADKVFKDLISDKMTNALDQEKIKIAGKIYNDMEDKDFEIDDEEQLTVASDEEEVETEVEQESEEESEEESTEEMTDEVA